MCAAGVIRDKEDIRTYNFWGKLGPKECSPSNNNCEAIRHHGNQAIPSIDSGDFKLVRIVSLQKKGLLKLLSRHIFVRGHQSQSAEACANAH